MLELGSEKRVDLSFGDFRDQRRRGASEEEESAVPIGRRLEVDNDCVRGAVDGEVNCLGSHVVCGEGRWVEVGAGSGEGSVCVTDAGDGACVSA